MLVYVYKLSFYCVNTSYPMNNCFTGRRDRSRQTTEKVILYKIPAGPVTECTFARCRLVHTSCLDRMTSRRLFRLARECTDVFLQCVCNARIFKDNYKLSFYCVNTSYPMDNCFTGRRDRSRQTPEKDVLYIIPAGPVSSVHSLGGASYLLPV